MHKTRRNLLTALVLGLLTVSTLASAIPASAASESPRTVIQPAGGIHR